jgi:butyrate kinase
MDIGSTTTRIGCCQKDSTIVRETVSRPPGDYLGLKQELVLRRKDILDFIQRSHISFQGLDLIVSRGGLGKPCPSGVYRVDDLMVDDLMTARYGEHVSAIGPAIALEMARAYGKEAVVVDPPSTDEFHELARFSGMHDIPRLSAFHALNQKAVARKACAELGKDYKNASLIVAHMGGGITIGAHDRGRVVDATHGLSEGPFTPERSGSLPALTLIDLVLSRGWSSKEVRSALVGNGGLKSYLGTGDARKIEEKISESDRRSRVVYEAMAYQISKEIAAMAAVLNGKVDAVVLTGGLACSGMLVSWIRDRVSFISPVLVFPGEDEIAALLEGGIRVLSGSEPILDYPARDDAIHPSPSSIIMK